MISTLSPLLVSFILGQILKFDKYLIISKFQLTSLILKNFMVVYSTPVYCPLNPLLRYITPTLLIYDKTTVLISAFNTFKTFQRPSIYCPLNPFFRCLTEIKRYRFTTRCKPPEIARRSKGNTSGKSKEAGGSGSDH